MLLSQLYKTAEINAEFKNMTKNTFLKLEKFILEKIEFKIKFDGLESSIQGMRLFLYID